METFNAGETFDKGAQGAPHLYNPLAKAGVPRMDALIDLFDLIKTKHLAAGNFLGFLNVFIGRRVSGPNGALLSAGFTFRELATWLKKVRWDPEQVHELGKNPDDLPLRDRQRYWFVAICSVRVDSPAAQKAGDIFAVALMEQGYVIVPASWE